MRAFVKPMANVPCNGCTACCKTDVVFIHPEYGDKLEDYQTVPMTHPLTNKLGHRLAHKPEGGCIYLGDTGCTIHERAPSMCKEFDCRRFYLQFNDRAERRRAIKEGMIDKAVLEAGRVRLHTLTETVEKTDPKRFANAIQQWRKNT